MPTERIKGDERVFVKVSRAREWGGLGERWDLCEVSPTLNVFDNNGDGRAIVLIVTGKPQCRR